MTTCWLDLETYSEVPIAAGTYRYAASCEVMLIAFAIDDGPVAVWDRTAGQPAPAALRDALLDPSVIVVAHNSQFDRTALRLGDLRLDIPIERWRCTMAQALSHALPGKLAALCPLLGVPLADAKHATGVDGIQLFCKPRPAASAVRRFTRHTHPAQWATFVEYAGSDVRAMRACAQRMPTWNWQAADIAQWHYDQRTNDRGFAVDTELAAAAIDACAVAAKDNASRTDELTGGNVDSVQQRDKLRTFLAEHGVDLPDMRAATLERRVDDPALPQGVRELLALRLSGSRNSTAKYRRLLEAVSADGRLRGTIQFRGASRTGRDAGRMFQPQNLPRPNMDADDIANWIGAVKMGATQMLGYDDTLGASNALRGAIVAGPGRKLVIADYANIEGRVLAWLAGVQWKLDAFREYDTILGYDAKGKPIRKGPDLYRVAYARSFCVELDEVTGDQRQVGKVIELACGYQGAVGAFQTMAAVYRVEVGDDVALASVKAWRRAHPEVVQLWHALEAAAKGAVLNPGRPISVAGDKLEACAVPGWLTIRLPSGRRLTYPQPRIEDGVLYFAGQNQYTRKWGDLHTYGGKLVENVVQAIAGDLLMSAKQRADAAGYPVVLPIHDELLTEPPDSPDYNVAGLSAAMCDLPAWAAGMPVTAAGFETHRYRKE